MVHYVIMKNILKERPVGSKDNMEILLYLENLKEFEYEQYTVETTYSKGDGVYEDMYIVNFVRDEMSECEVCISANDERLISISINDESKDYYAASAEVTNDLID